MKSSAQSKASTSSLDSSRSSGRSSQGGKADPKKALEKLGPRPSPTVAPPKAPLMLPPGSTKEPPTFHGPGVPPPAPSIRLSPIMSPPEIAEEKGKDKASPLPIEILKNLHEAGGAALLVQGEHQWSGVGMIVIILRQGVKFIFEMTFLGDAPDELTQPSPAPITTILRYGHEPGWFTFEMPGWGSLKFFPGDPELQCTMVRRLGIQAMTLLFRAQHLPARVAKSGIHTIMFVFQEDVKNG